MTELNGFQQKAVHVGWHSVAPPFPSLLCLCSLLLPVGTLLSDCLPSAAVLSGLLGTCIGALIYELPRFAICTHLLVLYLPLIGMLLMLLAFCVGMLFESRHPQFAFLGCWCSGFPPLVCNWNLISVPPTCQAPCWQFVPLQPQLLSLSPCKLLCSCSFILQNSYWKYPELCTC